MLPTAHHTPWKSVAFYILVATSISLLFRVYSPPWLEWLKLPYGYGLSILVGAGPFLGAILTRKVVGNRNEPLSFYGHAPLKSLLFMLIPSIVLIGMGIKNRDHLNEHVFALKLSVGWLLYIVGEEYGWRGYLQQILKLNDYWKALVVGCSWYMWHLSLFLERNAPLHELLFLAVLLVGSFVAIKITTRTHSLLTSVGMHFCFSVLTNIPTSPLFQYGLLAILLSWFVMLWKWRATSFRIQ